MLFGRIRAVLSGFLVLLILISCSPQKRALRHIKKAESLCPECFVNDTFVLEVPGREISESISLLPGEIRTIERDGMTLSVRAVDPMAVVPELIIECVTDTVFVTKAVEKITPPKIVAREKSFFEKAQDFLFWVFIAIIGIILLPRILDAVAKK